MKNKRHPLYQFKYCPKCGSSNFVENNTKSKHCSNCGFTYYFNPSSATVAIIINKKKEILVATRKNDPAKGTLDLPGGFVDIGETGEEAVIREVKEESGLEVISTRYLFSLPNTYIYSDFEIQTTDLFYLCEIEEETGFVPSDDVTDLEFMPLTCLDSSKFGLKSIQIGIEKIKKLDL